MKRILLAIAVGAMMVSAAEASHVKIISTSHYVEGMGSYFDADGQEVRQSYQVPDERIAYGNISVGQKMSLSSYSGELSVAVGPISAYGSSDKGQNKAYAYAALAVIFEPVSSMTHINLIHSIRVYPCDTPVGGWAWLRDLTAGTSLDSVWWRTQDTSEIPGGWQGAYNLDPAHQYKLVMNVAADAADDGGWFARMEAVMAPEPATIALLTLGAFVAFKKMNIKD